MWVVSLTSGRLVSGEQAPCIHWIWLWLDSRAELDILDKRSKTFPTGNWITIPQLPTPYPKRFVTSAVTMGQSPSCESSRSSASQGIPAFYGTRKFITASQEPTTCPCPQPDPSSADPSRSYCLMIHFNIILPSTWRSFPLVSPLKACMHLSSLPYVSREHFRLQFIIQSVPLPTKPGISLIILNPIKILQRNRHTHYRHIPLHFSHN